MANSMRWRYGDTNPVMVPVAAATTIEIGDLVFLDSDQAKPASAQTDKGSELSNQEEFHDNFLGVAMQASAAGEAGSIRVATTGVFEFECQAATFELGEPIGVAENAYGTALESQQVIAAATVASAFGRSALHVTPAAGKVLVDVVSSVMKGGVQAVA